MTSKKFPGPLRGTLAGVALGATLRERARRIGACGVASRRVARCRSLCARGSAPRAGRRGRGAAQARRRYRRELGFGAVIRRLHGGADRGRPCEGHRRRRHRRGRALRLRRERRDPGLPVLADRRGAERGAGALPMHEDRTGARRTRRGSAKRAKELAEAGEIDPLDGLKADNVYLFSGNEGPDGHPARGGGGQALLQGDRRRAGNITLVERRRRPRLPHRGGRRGLRHLGRALRQRLRLRPGQGDPRLDLRPAGRRSPEPQGRFIVFDQSHFTGSGDGFADEGMVYVPEGCAEQPGCRVHIALHGCEQSREKIGDTFIKESGFAEVADKNRLIVLFPQIKASTSTRKAAGIGGAIPASTISARTRPRSRRSGPWSSSSPRRHERRADKRDLWSSRRRRSTSTARPCLREAILRRPIGLVVTAEELADDERAAFLRDVPRPVVGSVSLKPLGETASTQADGGGGRAAAGEGRAGSCSHAEGWARGRGFRLMVLNARLGAEGFYARYGYLAQGEPFDENTVPHIRMTKRLVDLALGGSGQRRVGRSCSGEDYASVGSSID